MAERTSWGAPGIDQNIIGLLSLFTSRESPIMLTYGATRTGFYHALMHDALCHLGVTENLRGQVGSFAASSAYVASGGNISSDVMIQIYLNTEPTRLLY